MKKNDFKKLAILGMIAGSTLSPNAAAADTVNLATDTILAGGGCGGKGKCSGAKAPSTQPSENQIAEEDEQFVPPQGSCGNTRPPANYREPTGNASCASPRPIQR